MLSEPGRLGSGYKLRIAWPMGLIWLAGITLLANGVLVPFAVVAGSKIVVVPRRLEKSPVRSAAVGTLEISSTP